MALHWFNLPRFETPQEALEALHPFGVRLRPELDRPARFYWSDDANGVLCDLGEVTVYKSGQIGVWPYRDLTAGQLKALIASAGNAFERAASRGGGWVTRRRNGRSYWWTMTVVRADDTGIAELIRAAREDRMSRSEMTRLQDLVAIEQAAAARAQ